MKAQGADVPMPIAARGFGCGAVSAHARTQVHQPVSPMHETSYAFVQQKRGGGIAGSCCSCCDWWASGRQNWGQIIWGKVCELLLVMVWFYKPCFYLSVLSPVHRVPVKQKRVRVVVIADVCSHVAVAFVSSPPSRRGDGCAAVKYAPRCFVHLCSLSFPLRFSLRFLLHRFGQLAFGCPCEVCPPHVRQ